MTEEAKKLGRQAVSMYCQTDGMYYSLLSKREIFAAMAMQGLLADSMVTTDDTKTAKLAVIYADALLEALIESTP